MFKQYICILLFINLIFSDEIYKLIKINNPTTEIMYQLNNLGAELDHVDYKPNEYLEFAASSSFLNRIEHLNIDFDIIHEDLQVFYESRLYNIDSRDFDYGSMGGYYTHQEIIDHLEELSNEYPDYVSSLQVIGQSLEGRDIYVAVASAG